MTGESGNEKDFGVVLLVGDGVGGVDGSDAAGDVSCGLLPLVEQYGQGRYRRRTSKGGDAMRKEAKGWRGILLAGGAGTRLHPATLATSKQMLPVYDKPMVYYPLTTLMLAGIREVTLVSAPKDIGAFERLLGNGKRWGMNIKYKVQPRPEGIAQALTLTKDFTKGHNTCLILGDNLFYGRMDIIRKAMERTSGATVFGYAVKDPERYGVVEVENGKAVSLEEKPTCPKSRYAVPGLYCYDDKAAKLAESLKPSARGELEITDLNKEYMARGELNVELLGRGMAWLDTGTPRSLLDAGNFVAGIQERQGLKIGCPEEVAFRNGWLTHQKLRKLADDHGSLEYGTYLEELAEEAATGERWGRAR